MCNWDICDFDKEGGSGPGNEGNISDKEMKAEATTFIWVEKTVLGKWLQWDIRLEAAPKLCWIRGIIPS